MTASSVLKKVRQAFPEIFESLPRPKLKLVENALVYASKLSDGGEHLSSPEHKKLLQEMTGKAALTPSDRLKAYRLREELSQVELAKRSDIPQANISAMETGRRPIGIQIARKLAKALHCDYRQLI